MKRFTYAILLGTLIQPCIVIAAEGPMCSFYHTDVNRKVKQIKSYGPNLSRLAQDKLYEDLKFDLKQCLAECESQKFKYCNDVAMKLEQNNPL